MINMTPELTYAALTILLAVVQIFLPAGGRTLQHGLKWNAGSRDAAVPASNVVTGRLERAQANLYETLPLFLGAQFGIGDGVVATAQVMDQYCQSNHQK